MIHNEMFETHVKSFMTLVLSGADVLFYCCSLFAVELMKTSQTAFKYGILNDRLFKSMLKKTVAESEEHCGKLAGSDLNSYGNRASKVCFRFMSQ